MLPAASAGAQAACDVAGEKCRFHRIGSSTVDWNQGTTISHDVVCPEAASLTMALQCAYLVDLLLGCNWMRRDVFSSMHPCRTWISKVSKSLHCNLAITVMVVVRDLDTCLQGAFR